MDPRRIALIIFIWCRVNQWTRETLLNWLNYRDFPLHALSFARLVPRAQIAFWREPSRSLLCTTILDIISPYVLFGARVRRRHMLRETARAPRRSLKSFTAREPMGPGLSSRRRLLLLASHRMALTRNARIRDESLEKSSFFSIFAWSVPTLVPKHNSRFRVFRLTICWLRWSINIYETVGRKKIAFSLWNVVYSPCSETGSNVRTFRRSLALDLQTLHKDEH